MCNITKTSLVDSGIAWIGAIPPDWKVESLKRLLSEPLKYGANEAGDTDDPSYPRYIRITDFGSEGLLRDATFKSLPPDKAHDYMLEDGDVLLARSGATVGKAFYFKNYDGEACFAGYLIRARAQVGNLSDKYLYFFTQSPAYESWKDSIFTQATIQNIGADKYAYLPVSYPPIDEQIRIAHYLDQTCVAIDRTIAIKQQQLEKLDQLRKSMIYKAVTKGLDDEVEMRESGVEWIGEVPLHWKKERIKNIVKLSPGYSDTKPTDDEFCTVVPMEAVSEEGVIQADNSEMLINISNGLTLFENGDVIIAKITPCMENGKGAYVENIPTRYAFGSTEFHVLRPASRINARFLYYYTYNSSFRDYAEKNMTGAAGQKRVSSKFLKYTPIYLPSVEDQEKIVDFIDAELMRTKTLLETISKQVGTLMDYKKSLIHECVTGKRRITEADLQQVA